MITLIAKPEHAAGTYYMSTCHCLLANLVNSYLSPEFRATAGGFAVSIRKCRDGRPVYEERLLAQFIIPPHVDEAVDAYYATEEFVPFTWELPIDEYCQQELP